MFTNKKIKSVVAIICAITSIVINVSSAIAAPVGSLNVDAIREKALGEYLTSNAVKGLSLIKAVNNFENAPVYKEIAEFEPANYNTVKKLNTALELSLIHI